METTTPNINLADIQKGRNNSQIFPLGGKVPICNYELIDEAQQIWKGELVLNASSRADEAKTIYFSRFYQPEVNDLDKIFTEVIFDDAELLGVPFILVPKEKFLFGFEKGSASIIIPRKPILSKHPHMQ